MQCACAVLSSVGYPALQYISTLSHKRKDFRKKMLFEHKMCFSIFSKNVVWNILHSKKNWARYDQSTDFAKNTQISSLMKVCALGAEFFPCGQTDRRTDGRTYVTKLIVLFRNFAKAPTNLLLSSSYLFVSPSFRSSVCLSVYLFVKISTVTAQLSLDECSCSLTVWTVATLRFD
jgi:hypothetical protein